MRTISALILLFSLCTIAIASEWHSISDVDPISSKLTLGAFETIKESGEPYAPTLAALCNDDGTYDLLIADIGDIGDVTEAQIRFDDQSPLMTKIVKANHGLGFYDSKKLIKGLINSNYMTVRITEELNATYTWVFSASGFRSSFSKSLHKCEL